MDIVVEGGKEFHELAKRLRKAGQKELAKELQKTLRDKAKTISEEQRVEVKKLPARGSKHTRLRSRVAGKVRVQVKSTGADAGVRIQVDKANTLGNMPAYLNIGSWRHPLFGNKKFWFKQEVPPGWFDKPVEKSGPKVREDMLHTLENISEKIAHGGI